MQGRTQIRLREYDYSSAGGYFVTICAHDRQCIFGDVENGHMVLNDVGKIAEFTWMDLTRHNTNIELDKFIVMPNHVHGIIIIVGAGSKPALTNQWMGLHERASLADCVTIAKVCHCEERPKGATKQSQYKWDCFAHFVRSQ